jgi:hypothetical protein
MEEVVASLSDEVVKAAMDVAHDISGTLAQLELNVKKPFDKEEEKLKKKEERLKKKEKETTEKEKQGDRLKNGKEKSPSKENVKAKAIMAEVDKDVSAIDAMDTEQPHSQIRHMRKRMREELPQHNNSEEGLDERPRKVAKKK